MRLHIAPVQAARSLGLVMNSWVELHSICLPEVGAMWTCADGGEAFQKLRPCGYVNGTRSTFVPMKAMRLGTLPIVAPTGGLKDTVEARTAA